MRKSLMIAAIGVMAVAGVSAAFYALSQPTRLTIAVGPPESDDAKMIEAIAHRLQTRREPVQIKIVSKSNSIQAAESVDNGQTDLAVTRADLQRPPSAGLMLTLHRDPVMILAARGSGIKKITDLRGKRVGVIRLQNTTLEAISNNTELLKTLLSYYSIADTALTILPLTVADLQKAVSEKRIDALFVVAPLGEPVSVKAVEAMSAGSASGPIFVPISEPDALILKNPRLVKDEIVRGAYGGEPAIPSAAIATISVPHSIVAGNSLSDSTVASLTRSIFSLKTVLTRDIRLAARIEAPSTNKDAAVPLHPGAAAFIDDEEESFFDKYGDIFYIGSMLIGVLASAFAAMFSRRTSAARNSALEFLEEGLSLVHVARKAGSLGTIEEIETRADHLVGEVVRNAVKSHLNQTDILSFNLALHQIRETLNTRRAALGLAPAPAIHAQDIESIITIDPRKDIPTGDVQDLLSRATIASKGFPKPAPLPQNS